VKVERANSSFAWRVLSNFCALSSLQMANMLLPLVSLPYLMRVLGPEKIGVLAIAEGFTQCFVVLANWGFGLSASREVSLLRDRPQELARCYSAVVSARLTLSLLGLLVFVGVIFTVPMFRTERFVFLLSYGKVIPCILFPIWFFQGLERMHFIAVLNLLGRISSTAFIFLLIANEHDYVIVPVITMIEAIFVGVAAQSIVFAGFRLPFTLVGPRLVFGQLREAASFFVVSCSIVLYTTTNPFLLGLFVAPAQVGYFKAAYQIARASFNLLHCLCFSLYPAMCKIASESASRAWQVLKRTLFLAMIPTAIGSLIPTVCAAQISRLAFGPGFDETIPLLHVLGILPFIGLFTNTFGIQGLLAFGHQNAFSRLMVFVTCIHLIIASLLCMRFGAFGMAVSVIITETLIAFGSFRLLRNTLRQTGVFSDSCCESTPRVAAHVPPRYSSHSQLCTRGASPR